MSVYYEPYTKYFPGTWEVRARGLAAALQKSTAARGSLVSRRAVGASGCCRASALVVWKACSHMGPFEVRSRCRDPYSLSPLTAKTCTTLTTRRPCPRLHGRYYEPVGGTGWLLQARDDHAVADDRVSVVDLAALDSHNGVRVAAEGGRRPVTSADATIAG